MCERARSTIEHYVWSPYLSFSLIIKVNGWDLMGSRSRSIGANGHNFHNLSLYFIFYFSFYYISPIKPTIAIQKYKAKMSGSCGGVNVLKWNIVLFVWPNCSHFSKITFQELGITCKLQSSSQKETSKLNNMRIKKLTIY